MIKTKHRTQNLIYVSMGLNGAIFITILACFGLQYIKPKPVYGIVNPKGETYQIDRLDKPNASTEAINSWAQIAVANAYTMDFVSYEDTLEQIRKYFTPAGYKLFLNMLESSERLAEIKAQKLRTSAVISGSPMILEGVENGKYTWNMQIPVLLSYEGASPDITNRTTVVFIKINRVPINEVETGIGISKISEERSAIQ